MAIPPPWLFPRSASSCPSVGDTIFLVHHLLQKCLIICVQWGDGDVANCSKLTTVVEMFILQTKEVPNKSPADQTINCLLTNLWLTGCCKVFLVFSTFSVLLTLHYIAIGTVQMSHLLKYIQQEPLFSTIQFLPGPPGLILLFLMWLKFPHGVQFPSDLILSFMILGVALQLYADLLSGWLDGESKARSSTTQYRSFTLLVLSPRKVFLLK